MDLPLMSSAFNILFLNVQSIVSLAMDSFLLWDQSGLCSRLTPPSGLRGFEGQPPQATSHRHPHRTLPLSGAQSLPISMEKALEHYSEGTGVRASHDGGKGIKNISEEGLHV